MKTVPENVTDGFRKIFADHAELSDLIMKKNGLNVELNELMEMAKAGNDGANGLPSVWLRNFTYALQQEVEELTESIAWKWWKPSVRTDLANVRVEIVDIFHFLISAAQASGMDADTFAEIYYKKRALNFHRQNMEFKEGDNEAHGIGNL